MAKQFNYKGLDVNFILHDGSYLHAFDDAIPRGESPADGFQFSNEGTNALDAYLHGRVIEAHNDGDEEITYVNPHAVIKCDYGEDRSMSIPTPWEDDFCQPVDGCDCGESGGVEYIDFVIDGEPARVTPQLPDTSLSYCGSYPTTMTIDFKASEGYELGYVTGDVVVPNPAKVPVDGGGVYKFITQKKGDASTQVRYSINITCQN